MTWLVEDPLPALVLGVVVEAILAIALVRTGRGVLIAAMVAVALITGAVWGVEFLVVTEREEVEYTLADVAAALESNDVERLAALMHPDGPGLHPQHRQILARAEVLNAKIGRDLDIQFNPLMIPPNAEARFSAVVHARDRSGQIPRDRWMGRFLITLHRAGDRWLIHEYAVDDPSGVVR